MSEETVVVKSIHLPEVRMAYLVEDRPLGKDRSSLVDERPPSERIYYKREAPAPPPRRVSLLKYDDKDS